MIKPDQPNQSWRGDEQEEFKNQDLTPYFRKSFKDKQNRGKELYHKGQMIDKCKEIWEKLT